LPDNAIAKMADAVFNLNVYPSRVQALRCGEIIYICAIELFIARTNTNIFKSNAILAFIGESRIDGLFSQKSLFHFHETLDVGILAIEYVTIATYKLFCFA
jgi:hypothetical protein